MALSQDMILWVSREVARAKEWLSSPDTTPSQKAVARYVLKTWSVR